MASLPWLLSKAAGVQIVPITIVVAVVVAVAITVAVAVAAVIKTTNQNHKMRQFLPTRLMRHRKPLFPPKAKKSCLGDILSSGRPNQHSHQLIYNFIRKFV